MVLPLLMMIMLLLLLPSQTLLLSLRSSGLWYEEAR